MYTANQICRIKYVSVDNVFVYNAKHYILILSLLIFSLNVSF